MFFPALTPAKSVDFAHVAATLMRKRDKLWYGQFMDGAVWHETDGYEYRDEAKLDLQRYAEELLPQERVRLKLQMYWGIPRDTARTPLAAYLLSEEEAEKAAEKDAKKGKKRGKKQPAWELDDSLPMIED
jgi:hypothetical protein